MDYCHVIKSTHCLSKASKRLTSVSHGATLWVSSISCCVSPAHTLPSLEKKNSSENWHHMYMMRLLWKLQLWLNRCVRLRCVYCWHKAAVLLKEWGQHADPFASHIYIFLTAQPVSGEASQFWSCAVISLYLASLTLARTNFLRLQLATARCFLGNDAAISCNTRKMTLYPVDCMQNCKQAVILDSQMSTERQSRWF